MICTAINGQYSSNEVLSSTGSKYVFELKLVLGLWRFWNIVVYLLQEEPYFLATLLKYGTDSIVKVIILELTGWIISSTKIMSSNTI